MVQAGVSREMMSEAGSGGELLGAAGDDDGGMSCWVSSGAARGEASPLWVDVQKLCNMCVLSLSWNFFVSHDKYIVRPSSKEPR